MIWDGPDISIPYCTSRMYVCTYDIFHTKMEPSHCHYNDRIRSLDHTVNDAGWFHQPTMHQSVMDNIGRCIHNFLIVQYKKDINGQLGMHTNC